MAKLPGTDLTVSDLCLGTNILGTRADEASSFAVLDRFLDGAGAAPAFLDTAESYGKGASEEVIGRWLAARGVRDRVVLATKASPLDKEHPLSAAAIRTAVEGSLRRLQTDVIDLYYAHYDDESTPLEETMGAFGELVEAGLVRHVAASNYSAGRLADAQATADRLGVPRYAALQTHYNLMERAVFEDELQAAAEQAGIGVLPYYGLAKGFLTGKYRPGVEVDSHRAKAAAEYLGERGDRVLGALREIADRHDVAMATVALRWLADQPTVVAPLASARTVEQLAELLPMQDLVLADDERQALTDASGV
jgi:aryl-alcohol dehydrogenase-like predicted oxidoreductase